MIVVLELSECRTYVRALFLAYCFSHSRDDSCFFCLIQQHSHRCDCQDYPIQIDESEITELLIFCCC